MAGLNNIREAYQAIYAQLDERVSDDEKEMRRLAAQERRAGKSDRMDSKTAKKYADSEAKSAEREDKKSKGKHIHGMADSYEMEGDIVDEKKDNSYLETDMKKRRENNEKAVEDMKKTKAHSDMVKAARKHFEEIEIEEGKRGLWDNIHAKRKRGERPAKPGEKGYPKTLNVEEVDQIIEGIKQARKNVGASKCWTGKKLGNPPTKMKGGKEVPNCVPEELELDERALDTAEKGEKERLVKGMKKSAADFKKRYGERAKSVMYATATKKAKEHMDTSKSDRRYAVEETSLDKREKLNKIINDIRSKKGESK
jgi:hypothetical protein